MKKTTLFPVFVIMSMLLLNSVSFTVVAHEQDPIELIEFSGKIAISHVPEIIQWRIVVDGTVTIDGEEHVGKYTVVRMLPRPEFPFGEIKHGPATVFNWKMKRCQLKMVIKDLGINLNVLWKAKSPTIIGLFPDYFGVDDISLSGTVQYREAEVSGVQLTNQGLIHRRGWGYIIDAEGVTGEITLASLIWDSDVQITGTDYYPSIWPTLGAEDGTIHLAWVDERDENREIYYKRSIDYGTTWPVLDERISNAGGRSIRTAFAVNNDAVHLFWRDDRDGNFEEYLRQSFDSGVTWGSETRITSDSGYSGCPFPVVKGDTLHLFWRDDREGTFQIYYKRSTDAGSTWGADTLLTPDAEMGEFPYPAINGDTIHLVWRDTRDGNAEIYYKRSVDNGDSWTEDERLTNDAGESEHPKIVVNDGTLHVVWRDDRDGNCEVYYKTSTDGGLSWSEDTRVTNTSGTSLWPVIAVSGDVLHLLWCEDHDGNQALYYRFSSDGGESWSPETKLSECVTPAGYLSAHPMIITGQYIHIAFNDDRTGENEIYYKRGVISIN